jgi:hypothetical protein
LTRVTACTPKSRVNTPVLVLIVAPSGEGMLFLRV